MNATERALERAAVATAGELPPLDLSATCPMCGHDQPVAASRGCVVQPSRVSASMRRLCDEPGTSRVTPHASQLAA